MGDIKNRIENYKSEYSRHEIGIPLILIAEILVEIKNELKHITNKMYE